MDFGYFIRPGESYEGMLDLARHAEELGLYGAFLNDHVVPIFGNKKLPFLESWTAITGIGLETKRLRVGHITLMNSMRNPAMLAKMISTLDNMIGGRYEIILGGGWMRDEYEGYDLMGRGRGVPSPKERVDRAKEAVHILRGMLNNEEFSHEGRYWTLKNAINIPQPVQKNIRISIGARKPRMFRISAKYCDGVNIQGPLPVLRNGLSYVLPALDKAGKKMDDFFFSGFDHSLVLTDTEGEYDALAKRMAGGRAFGFGGPTSVENIKENAFVGTPEALVGKLRKAEDMGMKLMIAYVKPASNVEESKERLTKFRDEVIKQL